MMGADPRFGAERHLSLRERLVREPKGGYAWNADHVTAVYQVLTLWLFGVAVYVMVFGYRCCCWCFSCQIKWVKEVIGQATVISKRNMDFITPRVVSNL